VDNYSRGKDLATILNFRPKMFVSKLLVDNYSRGNGFATIKMFDQERFGKQFKWITILEEIILRL
jgi:hypothetical protein